MKSRKKDFGGCRDLISGLPDALICHILSFLPTKEAASTTVLAQRWKHLLAFVTNLEFDDSFYFHHAKTYEKRRKNSESFMHFVDSVLALQAKAKAPPLNRFHVKCEDAVDQYHVLDWIPKVLKRGVLDIDLYIPSSSGYCSTLSFYPLPSNIFVSKTLVRLKIEFVDGVDISVAGDVSLPNLKMLHLDYFKIDTITFNKLLSGCLALEELVLINLLWDSGDPEPCSVTVSIPTLKRLKFIRSDGFYAAYFHDGHGHDFDEATKGVLLSFDNPNLVYFEYSDAIVDTCQQVSFVTLVEASLSLRDLTDQSETDMSNVTKLFMGICTVKILYLSDDTLEVLAFCHETIPVFHNLIQLTIMTAPYVGWETLTALLKNCPNLQTLVFQGLNMDVRTCLSSSPVKVLKILNFGETSDDYGMDDVGDEDEDDASCDDIGDDIQEQIEQVKQFLETMPDLEELILYYNTPKAEDVIKVFKQLEKLPRVASANCNVHLKSDNLSLSFTLTKRGTLL